MPNPDYKKMFAKLKAFHPDLSDLDSLALIMSGLFNTKALGFLEIFADFSLPKIPAGYTYLAQFVSHDISFDEANDRHTRSDFPKEIIDPESLAALRNLRQPNFNLETVYGHESPANQGEIPRSQIMLPRNNPEALPLLRLGNTEGVRISVGVSRTARSDYPCDLPRGVDSVSAVIPDLRNDENLLLAQTHVAFIKFHNAIVASLNETGKYKYEELFEKARKLTIRHYQKIILTDLLPKVILKSVLEETVDRIKPLNSFYRPDMFMPLEFSVAAFRFAHTMIRNDYDVNSAQPKSTLEQLMMLTGRGEMRAGILLNPRLRLPSDWIIDWNLFYEINGSQPNAAENIDTRISIELTRLVPEFKPIGRANLLAILDLYRGRRFGLPTGQDVAGEIGAEVLSAEAIKDLIMSKKVLNSTEGDTEILTIKENLCSVFGKETPLWFYILAEAENQAKVSQDVGDIENFGKLGQVGSSIIAETFIQLLINSDYSILTDEWNEEDILPENEETSEKYSMPEMLKFIQETTEKHYEKLYPAEFYPQTTKIFDELNPLEKGYQDTN